ATLCAADRCAKCRPAALALPSPAVPSLFSAPRCHRVPPSFPTRRSSDLIDLETLLATERSRAQGVEPAVIARSNFKDAAFWNVRSEEHTSELQSRENLVCRLLLEKKKSALDPRACYGQSTAAGELAQSRA